MVNMEWYWNRYQSRNLAVTVHRGLMVYWGLGVLVHDMSETSAAYDLYKVYEPLNPCILVSGSTMKCFAFLWILLKRILFKQ